MCALDAQSLGLHWILQQVFWLWLSRFLNHALSDPSGCTAVSGCGYQDLLTMQCQAPVAVRLFLTGYQDLLTMQCQCTAVSDCGYQDLLTMQCQPLWLYGCFWLWLSGFVNHAMSVYGCFWLWLSGFVNHAVSGPCGCTAVSDCGYQDLLTMQCQCTAVSDCGYQDLLTMQCQTPVAVRLFLTVVIRIC